MNLNQVGAFLKSHWPAIVAFFTAFYAQFGSVINAYVAAHPKLTVWAAMAAFTVAYYVKSPRQASSNAQQGGSHVQQS
jgi:hypothetical protein